MVRSIGILLLGLLISGSCLAQQKSLKEQVIGSWAFVSAINVRPDGTKSNSWDPKATGSLIYLPNGRFSFMIMRSDIPKFEREKATPEQHKAAVQGLIAYHGTYTVDEATKTIIHRVQGSSFAAFNGTEQKRIVTSITTEELKYTNPASSFGAKVESSWRRAK
jgi:lipocalin-like protein